VCHSQLVFDHVRIRAADLEASVGFYRTLLGALGIEPSRTCGGFVEWDDFSVVAADDQHPPTRHLHIGFGAASRAEVDRAWQAGTDAGHPDAGQPGPRPVYSPEYYGGFLLDPDGNSAEAVHHEDIRRGGHVDHLWIGVADLSAAEGFYRTISRHVGLRPGRRLETRAQFRGAWATLSLVQDGRPPVEGLHMAFPAPDRQTVREFHRAALQAGQRDHGAPGERPGHHQEYFSAYALDPDGTSVESVFRGRG
jgi:catechol 2,3-dioxygenase-like lactoylglutathione lyase family enzyme